MRKLFSFILVISVSLHLHAQDSINITGKISSTGVPIPDVVIELKGNQRTIRAISNANGVYNILNFGSQKGDSLQLKISAISYKTKVQKIYVLQKNNIINFDLLMDTAWLKEVTVNSRSSILQAGKSVYFVKSENFIPNAKAEILLQTLPSLTIQPDGIVLINNHLKAIFFIDGIEADENEVKKLNVGEINKVEIISNPSASYGVSFTGGVINIITKQKSENLIKGEIETYVKARLNIWGIVPGISYKSKRVTFKSFYSYRVNNQMTETTLDRTMSGGLFVNQKENNEITGYQEFAYAKLKYDIAKNSILNLGASFSAYKFNRLSTGSYINNTSNELYNTVALEQYGNWNLYSVYQHKIDKQKSFFVKTKYYKYNNYSNSTYNTIPNNQPIYNEINSLNDEMTGEFIYENALTKIFQKPLNYTIGSKSIFRNFYFYNPDFTLKQQINNLYFDLNIESSDKLSFSFGLMSDITHNTASNINQHYFYMLPTFSALYQFKNKLNFKFEYAKKILRPNVDQLNPQVYFINPSLSINGNENLLPQLRNYYSASLVKTMKNNMTFAVNIFDENIKNAIVQTYTEQGGILISSFENAGKYNMFGSNASITLKLFKIISLNGSTGLNYFNFISNSNNSLIKTNSGVSSISSLSLSSVIHKKTSLSLNCFYNTKTYSLVSTSVYNPIITISAERTFLKDKLNVRVTYYDAFGLYTKSIYNTKSETFNQTIINHNKVANVTLSLTYNFGKTFNDRFSSHVISNDDIQNK